MSILIILLTPLIGYLHQPADSHTSPTISFQLTLQIQGFTMWAGDRCLPPLMVVLIPLRVSGQRYQVLYEFLRRAEVACV